MDAQQVIVLSMATAAFLVGCKHPAQNKARLQVYDILEQAALRHLEATFPKWAGTNYVVSGPWENAFPPQEPTQVRYSFEVQRPRSWHSTGQPVQTVGITMDMKGVLIKAARGGHTRPNCCKEDRDIIVECFRQAGHTNYWDWSLDVDESGQYAVRVDGYPLSSFASFASLPIRRLDVIVAFRPLDLSGLTNMPLRYLQLHKTPVIDLLPLAFTNLKGIELSCTPL